MDEIVCYELARQVREAANVNELHRDLEFLSGMSGPNRFRKIRDCDVLFVDHEPPNLHISAHSGLAGETDRWSQVKFLGENLFRGVSRLALFEAFQNEDAAG